MDDLVKILLVLLFIGGIIYVLSMIFKKNEQLFGYKSTGDLEKSHGFYERMRKPTLEYLKAVYPLGDNLDKLDSLELAAFYNSLWYYYNCESEFNKGVLCWDKMEGCGDKIPKLPYTPQGWFYSFKDFIKNWTPFIYSNSTLPPKEITGSVPGETFGPNGFYYYSGPADVWMYQRAMFRMIYNPVYYKVPGYNRIITVGEPPKSKPSDVLDMSPAWKYPENWWRGVPDYGFMEITAASEPGLPYSPPLCWYDGWVGSGQFLNVGRSYRSRNKASCCLGLAKEMAKTEDGKVKLREWFGSDDPYLVAKRVGFFGSAKTFLNDDPKNESTFPRAFTICNVPNDATWGQVNTYGAVISDQEGKPVTCNFCNNSWGQAIALPDTPKGWAETERENIYDWSRWCTDKEIIEKDGQKVTVPVLSNACIDELVTGHSYYSDRFNNDISWDEPNFVMGVYLDYDTIQNTNSANGNGFWQYEIMELRGFSPEVKNKIKDRNYSSFIRIKTGNYLNTDKPIPNDCSDPVDLTNRIEYIPEFVKPYMNDIGKYMVIRDPLSPQPKTQADANKELADPKMKCELAPYPRPPGSLRVNYGADINMTCQNNLSKIFNDISIVNCKANCNPREKMLCQF